jgi:membrane protein DedA with SNARE-associated domain
MPHTESLSIFQIYRRKVYIAVPGSGMLSERMFVPMLILDSLTGSITDLVSRMGYEGIFLLMAIESAGLPIPSELIMTFGGYLASMGKINWLLAALIGTLGTGFGSAIGYAIGAWGGKPLVDRYGRYLGVTPDKMVWAEKWFCKFGESAVFYTRLLPVVRTIVNVPAGLLGMSFYKFMAYTIAGALPWCLVLAYLGFSLGKNWDEVLQYSHPIAWAIGGLVLAIIVGAIVVYLLVRLGYMKKETVMKYLKFITHI